MTTSGLYRLEISRLLQAPRALLWQAWSNPKHLQAWWCPKPWETEVLAFDFVAGGGFHTLMRGPDGQTSDNPGCFLAIDPQSRIVSTSMLLAGWQPAHNPWMPMTAIITMKDEAGGTRYTASALHASQAGCEQHASMGFYEGWNICIDQLDAYALSLAA